MAAVSTMESDHLTNHIFSILENKFLFGRCSDGTPTAASSPGKVRILSIDAGGSTDGVLAARSLACLEAALRAESGNPGARIADFFDVVAGSGVGGVLAGLLFTRGKDGSPLFTAGEALCFVLENGGRFSRPEKSGVFRRRSRTSKLLKKVFGEATLKDTLKSVLIPCFDLTTGAPFVFSRADALEMDACDFPMADVCGATLANRPFEIKSVDGRTRTSAVGGGVAMSNPAAAAITHVLNNKQEFPFSAGVEDLLVVSLGNGEPDSGDGDHTPSSASLVKIVGCGAADMVDQAVSMAFSSRGSRSSYVRIQGRGEDDGGEEMLKQRNVETVLFRGKKLAPASNLQTLLHSAAPQLLKEHLRRTTCRGILPPVVLLKQQPQAASASSPRTSSSSTILSSNSSC